jgi:succinoglycan biosynthesis protein ExoA
MTGSGVPMDGEERMRAKSSDPTPALLAAVVMPALNEESYIVAALESLSQGSGRSAQEILVLDGGSTDGTAAVVEAYGRRDPRVRLVANEKRLQAAAVNRAAEIADPAVTVLIRADCHAVYPPDFVEGCLASLEESGAQSVVVPMETRGIACFQRAVAAAQNSLLGNGGSAHRRKGASRFVDHGHHAAFRRDFFREVGGYDETFSHNEDAELDLRIGQAGGRTWLNADLSIVYYPRSSVGALFRQYVNHGRGRARTYLKHRPRLKARQMAPLVIVFATLGGLVLSPLSGLFLALPLGYAGLCLGWGLVAALRERDACLLGMGIAAMAMHFGWAFGFLRQGLGPARSAAPRQG